MAKQSGLGDNIYVGGYDLSGDINSVQRIGGGPAAIDFTSIKVDAHERQGGLRDGELTSTVYFNKAANQAHPVLSALPTTDIVASYLRGTGIGKPVMSLVAKQVNYDGNRGNDGQFLFNVQALPNAFGVEWGEQLTAGIRTDSAATNGASHDFLASTAFGLQAYLHVFAFTGTSATVKLQESSDNGGADPFADVVGGAFASVTGARVTERIQTSRTLTVERYLRVVTTGTFSNLQFAVMVTKNSVNTQF